MHILHIHVNFTSITKLFLFCSSSPLKEGEQEDGEDVGEGEKDGGEHVTDGSQEGEVNGMDGSQDGGDFSSDSEGLDVNKVFKEWQEFKDGHKLER